MDLHAHTSKSCYVIGITKLHKVILQQSYMAVAFDISYRMTYVKNYYSEKKTRIHRFIRFTCLKV